MKHVTIKKRITPVRDGNLHSVGCLSQTVGLIKKRITPVRDGNCLIVYFRIQYIIKKRITPVRDGNY